MRYAAHQLMGVLLNIIELSFKGQAIMKKSGLIVLGIVAFCAISIGYLSSVQIPAPVKSISKTVPNEQLPR